MNYICPDLICPYCGKHTYYNIDRVQYVTSKQVCQNCGKIFQATMQEPRERDELTSDDIFFLNYTAYKVPKLKEKENG